MDRAAAIVSAGAVVLAGLIALALVETGPLSSQMAVHIAVMNVVAPLAAAWRPLSFSWAGRGRFLVAAAVGQMVLLWASHLPHAVSASMSLHLPVLVALAAAAISFWIAILAAISKARWAAVAALLLTGKLSCLLGALLIFAPGEIYRVPIDDQQLAGLFMITACPLSYVVAGIVLAAQALADLDRGRRCSAG